MKPVTLGFLADKLIEMCTHDIHSVYAEYTLGGDMYSCFSSALMEVAEILVQYVIILDQLYLVDLEK